MTHPITPPPQLVEQWSCSSPIQANDENWAYELFIAHRAAQWGADQELEACCEWIPKMTPWDAEQLRAARRPKLKSVKEYALDALDAAIHRGYVDASADIDTIRRALEQLDD
jgi:hypothetical protein